MKDSLFELRLLGSFRISRGGRTVRGFESQKVRALLAYLAVQQERSFSRDHLAALLWPGEPPEAARQNLRQALYNLRRTLASAESGAAILEITNQSLRLVRGPSLWVDVDEFEASIDRAGSGRATDTGLLASAARLYEGELLPGFHVEESPEFEEWLVTEQERLRERAIGALQRLVDHHLEAGTYSLGVEYGRRWIKVDPLSEAAHRRLMRLHALSGRRSRAIAQYQELVELLDEELGVEPVEETTAEYEAILAEKILDPSVREKAAPVGPLVPLVGRDEALGRLRAAWAEVRAGRGRLLRVQGEQGIGKTRLIKTFLHEATAKDRCLVLQGRFYELAQPVPFLAFAQALGDAVVHEVEVAETLVTEMGPEGLAELALLVPALHELRPALPAVAAGPPARDRLFEAVAGALTALARAQKPNSGESPVILFLDDLQAADRSSLELLAFLEGRLADEPVWLLGATTELEPSVAGEVVELGRLGDTDIRRIAKALAPDRDEELARILERSSGLPLALTELINRLWDRGHLVEGEDGAWRLAETPPPEQLPGDLEALVLARIEDLPTSTRRLFTLAAVAGPQFDADLLAGADQEQGSVVELGIHVLLERWLGRLRLGYWADSRQDRDLTLWSAGTRRARFEFSHPALREIVYRSLDPERRVFLHRRVAEVLEARTGAAAPRWRSEILAFHHLRGGSWERALAHLEEATVRALRLRAVETARDHLATAQGALEALERERPEEGDRWREARQRFAELHQRLGPDAAASAG